MVNLTKNSKRGSAMMIAILLSVLFMSSVVYFLFRSMDNLAISRMSSEGASAYYQMEAAYEIINARVARAAAGIQLSGKLPLHQGGPASESYDDLVSTYTLDDTATHNFFVHAIEVQAMDMQGTVDLTHEFADFYAVFPTTWTPSDGSDNFNYEYKTTFTPLPVILSSGRIVFRYELHLSIRSFGAGSGVAAVSEDYNLITVNIFGLPFSSFELLRSQNTNKSNTPSYLVGGNGIQDIFTGPVHLNQAPQFLGHPTFKGAFTSSAVESDWIQASDTDHTCCADFQGSKQGGVDPIEIPTLIQNTIRLAAGDPTDDAATNNDTVTDSELVDFLREHVGNTFDSSVTTVPNGIYIPVDDQSNFNAAGGIYIEGDVRIRLNVVQGSGDFSTDYWSSIQSGHQSCKFQKILIEHTDSGVGTKEIYIGDDPCDVTYVFNPSDPFNPAIDGWK